MKNLKTFAWFVSFLFALSVCAVRAQATDIKGGTITSTLTIFDDSRLVGDVTCAVPLSNADSIGASACIAFGRDHIKLKLNGHTISGPVVPPVGCSLPSDSTFGVGVLVEGNTDVEIEGPGVIQHFERWGILLRSASDVTVRKVTANRNCWSGMQVTLTSDSNFEEDIWINNAAGSNGAACGGICLVNSNKNRIHKSTFYGNGSVDYANGNVDFGIGFEGTSSENRAKENDIGGNTNGVLFFNSSSDNVVQRNTIAGNPAAQVIKTFTAANQQGADIAFRPVFTGTNNKITDNFCLTYIQGAGPATAPCPNIVIKDNHEKDDDEARNSPDKPLGGQNESNGASAAKLGMQIVSAIASVLAIAFGRLAWTGR